jgi:hypothetical protein
MTEAQPQPPMQEVTTPNPMSQAVVEQPPQPSRKTSVRTMAIIVLLGVPGVFVVLGVLGTLGVLGPPASSPSLTAPPAAPQTLQPILALVLVGDYRANELAADQKYKGKWFLITGTVADIGKAQDMAYVLLNTEFTTNVLCYLRDQGEVGKAAQLTKGQAVSVAGMVDGLDANVIVKYAEIR